MNEKVVMSKEVNKLLSIRGKKYLDEVIAKFEAYSKRNNLSDGINTEIYQTFKDELEYLNYDKLTKFRRGILLVTKIKKIYS